MSREEMLLNMRRWSSLQKVMMIPCVGFAVLLLVAARGQASDFTVWMLAIPFLASCFVVFIANWQIQYYAWRLS